MPSILSLWGKVLGDPASHYHTDALLVASHGHGSAEAVREREDHTTALGETSWFGYINRLLLRCAPRLMPLLPVILLGLLKIQKRLRVRSRLSCRQGFIVEYFRNFRFRNSREGISLFGLGLLSISQVCIPLFPVMRDSF